MPIEEKLEKNIEMNFLECKTQKHFWYGEENGEN